MFAITPKYGVKSSEFAKSSAHRIFMGKLGIDSFLFTVFRPFKIVCTHRLDDTLVVSFYVVT